MKIVFVLDSLSNAGTEVSTLQIISRFSASIKPIVIYLYKRDDLKKDYLDKGIDLYCLSEKKELNLFQLYNHLKELIHQVKPDLMVSSLYKSNILSRIISKRFQIKLVGTFVTDSYGNKKYGALPIFGRFTFHLYKYIDKVTSTIPQLYLSNSNYIKISNATHLNIPFDKCKVIYRGREISSIQAWQIPQDLSIFKFVIISRIIINKGYKELIEAFNTVVNKYSRVELHIYGDGNYKQQVEQKVIELQLQDKVIMYGNTKDASSNLFKYNCFIFPSWYEGLSGALIEAGISGIPIIASDIQPNIEVIDGLENAILFNVNNVSQLAEKMMIMIENYLKYANSNKQARALCIKKFDINVIAKAYEKELLNI